MPEFKDVPTLKEAGFDVPSPPQPRGVVGPPGMAPEVLAYYVDLIARANKSPGWQKFLRDGILEEKLLGPKETAEFLAGTEKQMRSILSDSGVKLVR